MIAYTATILQWFYIILMGDPDGLQRHFEFTENRFSHEGESFPEGTGVAKNVGGYEYLWTDQAGIKREEDLILLSYDCECFE